MAGWDRRTSSPPRGGYDYESCGFSFPGGEGLSGLHRATLWAAGLAPPFRVDSTWRQGVWHLVMVQVFPDGTCGFIVDGAPIWRTTRAVPLQLRYRLFLDGNSAGTNLIVGPVEVWEGVRTNLNWSRRIPLGDG